VDDRFFSALFNSIRITLRNLWRVAVQLFHEATGTFFALFAAYGGLAIWRQWKTHPAPWVTGFAVIYTVMMLWFAFGAFRRARRVR